MDLCDYIEKAAQQAPGHPALVMAGSAVSYEQLVDRVVTTATGLGALGLPAGATVAILSDNCPEVCVAQLAINRAGLAWTSIHPSVTTETAVEVLAYLGARFIFFQAKYEAKARATLAGVPDMVGAVCLDGTSELGGALPWRADTQSCTADAATPADAAWLQHTGGAGGPCHGTVHSRQAIEIGLANIVDTLDATPASRHLVVAPLTHAAGIFALAFASIGATNVLEDHFDVARVDCLLREDGITHIFLPPTALYALLDHVGGRAAYPALRCMVVAGAPVSPERFSEAVAVFGPVLYEVYGQTETLLALVKRPGDYLRGGDIDASVARSAGRAVRFARVALLGDDGMEVPPGERGEIAVRTSMLMDGYYRKPEMTARSRRAGWHLTGDIGTADSHGYITIVDRKREMIVSGAFNVFPAEVEAVLRTHPDVAECAVFGVPDARWGEAVHAVVAWRPGAAGATEELARWSKQQLGSVKAPKAFEVASLESLPRDPQGGIDKAHLKAPYWDGQWRRV